MSLAYVEAYRCAYCTTRWWYGDAKYDPKDNVLESLRQYYFPY
ncbi:MAG: hypothetical protein KatS3mg112_0614 [Thermogutta sp.]|nr:MAG: hypothetical protein KatS3mg112_0614 [Thermogutta sp.]